MPKTYTASVVGAGGGGRASMKGVSDSTRYNLHAVADLDSDVRAEIREIYPGVQTFSNHHEMFAQCPTDIVCVSTWPPSHLEVTRDALNSLSLSGMVVEKPLADNAADARTIFNLIREKKLPVVVPHGLMASEHIDCIYAHVRAGELGELRLIEIQCTNWDIINAGIHWLNFVVNLVEEPFDHVLAACDKTTRTYRDDMQVETLSATTIQTKSGIRITMHLGDHVSGNGDGNVVFRILGTEGDIEFYGWQSAYRIRNADHPTGERIDVSTDLRTRHQRHLENLAVQMDRDEPDYHLIENSWTALELCEAAYLSARHGCAISLPLADFPIPDKNDWDPGMPYSGSGGGRNGRTL